jgi:hypothetical protein
MWPNWVAFLLICVCVCVCVFICFVDLCVCVFIICWSVCVFLRFVDMRVCLYVLLIRVCYCKVVLISKRISIFRLGKQQRKTIRATISLIAIIIIFVVCNSVKLLANGYQVIQWIRIRNGNGNKNIGTPSNVCVLSDHIVITLGQI